MPLLKSSDRERGAITARLIVDLIRTVAAVCLVDNDAAVASDLVMMCAALFVGQAEGRPMTASNIADYIGMPRPSVVRKLQLLHMRGIVAQSSKRGWRLATDHSEIALRAASAIAANAQQITKAAHALSKLDKVAIDGRKPKP